MSEAVTLAQPATTRLYISPLSAELFKTIIPQSLQSLASGAEFRTLATFPDRPYGFVELPATDAERLRKKLNGSILRGMKMKVEEARPDNKRKHEADDVDAQVVSETEPKSERQLRKRAKKEKEEPGVLQAVQLPEGRRVQRGWEQEGVQTRGAKGGRKRGAEKQSKKDDKTEESGKVVFRAKLPANTVAKSKNLEKVKTTGKKSKASGTIVEVKEQENTTTFPSFLRTSKAADTGPTATEFVDGKGWVDTDGEIVESVPERQTRSMPGTTSTISPHMRTAAIVVAMAAVLEEGLLDSPDSDSSQSHATNTSISSSDSVSDSSSSASPSPSPLLPAASLSPVHPPSLTQKPIHPLEALFKRPPPPASASATTTIKATDSTTNSLPKKRALPNIKTAFSFFDDAATNNNATTNDPDADADADDERPVADPRNRRTDTLHLAPPQTPFTKRDLDGRSIRSAAPTPDTAAIGGRFAATWRRPSESESESESDSSSEDAAAEQAIQPEPVVAPSTAIPAGASAEDNSSTKAPATRTSQASLVAADDNPEGQSRQSTRLKPDAAQAPSASTSASVSALQAPPEPTEFEKRFWERRGEGTRAWKATRRAARKEARQAESRRTGVQGGV